MAACLLACLRRSSSYRVCLCAHTSSRISEYESSELPPHMPTQERARTSRGQRLDGCPRISSKKDSSHAQTFSSHACRSHSSFLAAKYFAAIFALTTRFPSELPELPRNWDLPVLGQFLRHRKLRSRVRRTGRRGHGSSAYCSRIAGRQDRDTNVKSLVARERDGRKDYTASLSNLNYLELYSFWTSCAQASTLFRVTKSLSFLNESADL